MLNPLVSFWFFGFLTCFITGCGESKPQAEPLAAILKALGESSEERRDWALQEVRSLHTNLLPSIVAEIEAIGRQEPDPENTELRVQLWNRKVRLSSVLRTLGPVLKPIREELAENLVEDKNYVNAIDAFVAMQEAGVPYLMLALTNRSANIQSYGLSSVVRLGPRRSIGEERSRFVGPLLTQVTTMLDDDSAGVRIQAAKAFSYLSMDLDSCVPKLLKMASGDPDVNVRYSCVSTVESLWHTRPIDAHLKNQIVESFGRIAADDKGENVRKAARSVLSKLAK